MSRDRAKALAKAAGRVVLESLRLDFDPEEAVRERAEAALALGAGGFIVFGGERDQVQRLIADLRDRVDRSLWFGADLERGAGQQFAGLPTLPPPAGIAAHPEPLEAARLAGAITARGARRLGIDLVFAPVLDLDVEPDNPIVGTRSFGRDPVAVAALAEAWVEGCQQEGVVACAKHFPGHGRTTADSHAEIPVVETPRRELDADLLPFRRLVPRVGAILSAHVAYPALGSEGPATLSHALLTDLLRDDMGFTGITVTDAMNMSGFLDAAHAGSGGAGSGGAPSGGAGSGGAASGGAPSGAARSAESAAASDPAVAALLAGCDLLLYPKDLSTTIDVLRAAAAEDLDVAMRVKEALARGEDVRARFLGERHGRLRPPAIPRQYREAIRSASVLFATGQSTEEIAGPLPPDPDALEASAISMLSIRRTGELPEWMRAGRPIRVIAIWDDREMRGRPVFGSRFVDEFIASGWQAALAEPDDQPERIPSIVLVASTPQAWKGTAGLTAEGAPRVEHALANPAGAYPVVFGHSRLLDEFGGTGICAWGTEPALELFAARKLVADAERGRGGGASGHSGATGSGPRA